MEEKMNKLIDKFSRYYAANGCTEIERNINQKEVVYNGKKRTLITGTLIVNDGNIPDSDRLGNFGVTRQLMMIEIRPQLHSYVSSIKTERRNGSDLRFNAQRELSHETLTEISKY